MKNTEKKTDSIRVTASTKSRFDRESTKLSASVGETLTQDAAVNHLLDLVPALSAKVNSAYPYEEANRELHNKLEKILNSGDEGTIKALLPNIELFFERLKPSQSKRRAG